MPRWAALALLGAAITLRIPAVFMRRWFNPDEAAIAMTAQALRRGQTLYVDMADRKPPLAALIYRLSSWLTGTDDARLPRLIAAVLLGLAAWVVAVAVARRAGRRAGWWSGVLLIAAAMAGSPADFAAANFSNLAVPFAAVAVVALRSRSMRSAVLGGAALGLAVLCRQSWMFSIPAAAASVLLGGDLLAHRLRRLAGAAVGGAVPFAVVPLLAPFGEFWRWTFTGNGGFLFSAIQPGETAGRAAASVGLFLAWHLALVGAAVARPRWRVDADLWLWVLCGLAAVVAGFRFFGHYWLQVVPPLAVLGGLSLGRARWPVRRVAATVMAATAVVAWVSTTIPDVYRDRHDTAALVRAIDGLATPDQRVFIWGSFPELAVEVHRPIAGGMVHTDFVVGRSGGHSEGRATLGEAMPGALADMLADLQAEAPAVIVDTSTSADLGYTNYPIDVLPQLSTWVRARYRIDAVVDGVTLWVRMAPKLTMRGG